MTSRNSATEPGQPCVTTSGSGAGPVPRTWMKWMPRPPTRARNCGSALSRAPAARFADAGKDAGAALGVALLEPALEELVDGLREAEEHPARALRPGPRRGFEDARDLGVVEARDDGPDQHGDRHAGPREGRHRLEPSLGACGARLHAPGELGVECGHREEDVRRALPSELGEEVGVARHQRRLGDRRDRLPEVGEHLEAAARDLEPRLDLEREAEPGRVPLHALEDRYVDL